MKKFRSQQDSNATEVSSSCRKPPDGDIPFDEETDNPKVVHCNNNGKQRKHRPVLASLMGGGVKNKRNQRSQKAINTYPSSDAYSPENVDAEFQPPTQYDPTTYEQPVFSRMDKTSNNDNDASKNVDVEFQPPSPTRTQYNPTIYQQNGFSLMDLTSSDDSTKNTDAEFQPPSPTQYNPTVYEQRVFSRMDKTTNKDATKDGGSSMNNNDPTEEKNRALADRFYMPTGETIGSVVSIHEEDTPLTSNQCLQDIKSLEIATTYSDMEANETNEVTNEVLEVDEDEIVVNRVLFMDDEEVQKELKQVHGNYYQTPSSNKDVADECVISVRSDDSFTDGDANVSQQCSIPELCSDLIQVNISANTIGPSSYLQLKDLWDAAMDVIGAVKSDEVEEKNHSDGNPDKEVLDENTEYVKQVLRKYNLKDGIIEQVAGDLTAGMRAATKVIEARNANNKKGTSLKKSNPAPDMKPKLMASVLGVEDDVVSEERTATTVVAANNNSERNMVHTSDDDSDIFSFDSPAGTTQKSDWGSLDSPDKSVARSRCNSINNDCVHTKMDTNGTNQQGMNALFDPFASFDSDGSMDSNKSEEETEVEVTINDISNFANFSQFQDDSGDQDPKKTNDAEEDVKPRSYFLSGADDGDASSIIVVPKSHSAGITEEIQTIDEPAPQKKDEELTSEGSLNFADFSLMNERTPEKLETIASFGQNASENEATPNFKNSARNSNVTIASEDSFVKDFPSPHWTPRVENSNSSPSFDNKRAEDKLSNPKEKTPKKEMEPILSVKQLPSILSDATALLESLKQLAITDTKTDESSTPSPEGEDTGRDRVLDILKSMQSECVQHLDKNIDRYAAGANDAIGSCDMISPTTVDGMEGLDAAGANDAIGSCDIISPTTVDGMKLLDAAGANDAIGSCDIISPTTVDGMEGLDAACANDAIGSCDIISPPIVDGMEGLVDMIPTNGTCERDEETPILPKKLAFSVQGVKPIPTFVSPVGIMEFSSAKTEESVKHGSECHDGISLSIAQRIAELQKKFNTN